MQQKVVMCLTPQHRCRCRPFCPVLFYLLFSTLFYNSHPSHYRSSLKKICASACGQFRIAINSSRNSSNRNNKPNTIESMLIQWLAMELIHFVKAISNQSSDNLISFSISTTTTIHHGDNECLVPYDFTLYGWTSKCRKIDEFDEEMPYKMDKILFISSIEDIHKCRQDTHKG